LKSVHGIAGNGLVLKLRRSITEDVMVPTDPVRVLVVGEGFRDLLASCQLVERNDCQYHFAKSQTEVAELPDLLKFDIVISSIRIPEESIDRLVRVLSGSRASLFYWLRVEETYWWLPVLSLGKECLGAPAFRPNKSLRVFEQLVRQIKVNTTTAS
jgi:hypothetical protein